MKRWVLEGTDYVYPRTTNKILEAYLKSKGVKDEDIMINYTPFSFSNWQSEVARIKTFGSAGKKTAVVSTINGDANVPFYKELAAQGIKATDIPVVAFSVGEEELAGLDTKPLVGHLAAWNYFESIKTPANKEFIKNWHAFIKERQARHQRSDGSPLYRLQHVGESGREGRYHRSRQGDRRAAGHHRAQPDRRLRHHDAEPHDHQAGVRRRDREDRPVQRGLAVARARCPAMPGPITCPARRT